MRTRPRPATGAQVPYLNSARATPAYKQIEIKNAEQNKRRKEPAYE